MVLDAMLVAATQTDNIGAAVKAGADWLDRAGVGALVRAKVRQSKRRPAQAQQGRQHRLSGVKPRHWL
jgi:hypothetical protein